MKKLSFVLPNDPDQKKVAAAALTAAVPQLMARGESLRTALEKSQEIYVTILGEQPLGDVLKTWEQADS